MLKTRKILTVLFCVVVVAGLSVKALAAESLLDEVQKRGVLRVGVMLDFPPLGSYDEKGQPLGFNVDLAKDMAEALGVKLEIIETVSANRIPALVSGRIDVSSAGLTITNERAKTVAFTRPDRRGAMFVLVKKDSAIQTLDDCAKFQGKIGTVRGTTPEIHFLNHFKSMGIEIEHISFDANADQLLALDQGKVEAIAETDIWFGEVMAKFPGKYRIVGPSYFDEYTGLAVRYGDPTWLHWVDTFLYLEHISGRVKELHLKYNMPYVPIRPAYE